MNREAGLAAAWAGATIVAILIGAAGIGSVRSQVTEAPTALGSPSPIVVASGGVPVVDQTTTTPLGAFSGGSSTTSPTPPPTSSTTSTTIAQTSSPTTTVPQASTSTTVPPSSTTKTYSTAGGEVRIRISGESVTFVAASPSQGWHAEVESYGPPTVEVKFEENKDHGGEIEFHAGFENGELVVTIHGD